MGACESAGAREPFGSLLPLKSCDRFPFKSEIIQMTNDSAGIVRSGDNKQAEKKVLVSLI
jgi:hypothetical protein